MATGSESSVPMPGSRLEYGMPLEAPHESSSASSMGSEQFPGAGNLEKAETSSEHDPFAASQGSANYRTTGWKNAAVVMAKMTIGVGVLSIPLSLHTLGGVVGCLFIVFWGLLNTYGAYILGKYKLSHPSIHSVADGAHIAMRRWSGSEKWASVARNIAQADFIITWIICSGVTTLALSIAFSAVSSNAICATIFGIVSFIIVATMASLPKINEIGLIAWIGFVSIVAAILTVTIAVTQRDRPASAPQTGAYDLGFIAWPPAGTTFATAFAAALAIFSSSANTPAFLGVIAEMREPKKYFRSVYVSMSFINATYLALGLTIYAYCGKWIASPALGSAGPTIKIIAYAIAIPGLIAGAAVTTHVCAKDLFVRILRDTTHLNRKTKTHWATWLACTYGVGLIAWVLAEAIPFFNSLVSLIGALGFAPLGVCCPALFWLDMHSAYRKGTLRQKGLWMAHIGMLLVGLFTTIAGAYAVITDIVNEYKEGSVGSPFSCSNNQS